MANLRYRTRGPLDACRDEEGYFLVMALVLTTAVMVMASGLALLTTASLRASRAFLERSKALYAAESGLNHALYLLQTNQVTPSQLAASPLTGALASGSYRVWLVPGQGQCTSHTLMAEGTSGDTTRLLRIRYKVNVAFPKNVVEAETECAGEYAFPDLALESAAAACERAGGCVSWPGKTISGTGPINILVNGNLTLDGTVNINVQGDVNIYVTGNLTLAPPALFRSVDLALNVSPQTRVNFYVYGDVSVGNWWSTLLGSQLNAATNGWIVFNVQGSLTMWPGAKIRVSPVANTSGPEGSVVFLFSTDGDFNAESVALWPSQSLIDWFFGSDPLTEVALYAPTREVDAASFLWLDNPAVFGSVVAGHVDSNCFWCFFEPGYSVIYNEHLLDFRQGVFGDINQLVRGSWREERPGP